MSPVPAKHSSRGFTLIELMVVIGLIGVLIAATLTIVPKVKRAVYGAATQSQLAAIATAIQAYYNDFHAYPGPLANNQLEYTINNGSQPLVYAVVGGINTPFQLKGKTVSGYPIAHQPLTIPGFASKITSSQNLVLGLLGGLELQTNPNVSGFVYDPTDIFEIDGVTPSPRGPASLNPASPRRQQSYLQVKPGEISIPTIAFNGNSGGSFADSAGRSPLDAMIPVFLDKYSEPLPILYYRTNVGGDAIVGVRSPSTAGQYVDDSGTALSSTDVNGNTTYSVPQYELTQNVAYVQSYIGTQNSAGQSPLHKPNDIHGLVGTGTITGPIDTNLSGTYLPGAVGAGGKNALAYFKDPSLNSTSNIGGTARQKDGFVLISAGPDRQYGTRDDLIYPGPLQP